MSDHLNTSQAVVRREHDTDKKAQRSVLVDPFGGIITDGNYTTKIDEVDANNTYVGKAQIGTATSVTSWQIKKISVSGAVTSVTWAEATDGFVNEWDERASYTYS